MDDSPPASRAGVGRCTGDDRKVCLQSGLELFSALILLELDLWYLRDRGTGLVRLLMFGFLIALLVRSHLRTARRLAVAECVPKCPARAWAEALVLTFGFALLLLAGASALHREHEGFEFGFVLNPSVRMGT